jgi:hypothetical protein
MANTKTPPKKAKKPAAKAAPKATAKASTKATAKAAPKAAPPSRKGTGGEVVLTKDDLLTLTRRLGEVAAILAAAVAAFDGKVAVIKPGKEFVMILKPIPGSDPQRPLNNC